MSDLTTKMLINTAITIGLSAYKDGDLSLDAARAYIFGNIEDLQKQ